MCPATIQERDEKPLGVFKYPVGVLLHQDEGERGMKAEVSQTMHSSRILQIKLFLCCYLYSVTAIPPSLQVVEDYVTCRLFPPSLVPPSSK